VLHGSSEMNRPLAVRLVLTPLRSAVFILASVMLALDDVIAAVATTPGGAARGIVRLSGPQTVAIVSQCFQTAAASPTDWQQLVQPNVVSGCVMCKFAHDGTTSDIVVEQSPQQLPADLFLWPTTRSYTRQPLAEIHTFGSPPLVQAVLQAVCTAGARLAQPGEFTLRAFLAGRIDLTQAEAVLGVVDAADRRQLHTALGQLAGGLSRPLQQLRSQLLDLLADLEAGLDFVEDDIRFVSSGELEHRLTHAAMELERIGKQLSQRSTGAGVPRVALAGWPNVGKSSLFNALVGEAAALVSAQAGTTRDYLTAVVDAGGAAVELIDTAGIEAKGNGCEENDEHEKRAGQKLEDRAAQTAAIEQHRQADLRLLCLDSTRLPNAWEQSELASVASRGGTLVVLTKCEEVQRCNLETPAIQTSSLTGAGLDSLRGAIHDALDAQPSEASVVAGTAARVRASIDRAAESFARARHLIAADAVHQTAEELVAAELRTALAELGQVVGAVYTDDLLDRIFSRFCIGK
jgi:tRNA modification GTPase